MWKTISCAVQGTGHLRSNTPCQDKTFELEKNGVSIIVLADGAGSAKMSDYGAERIVHDAAEYTAEHFTEWLTCDDGIQAKRDLLEYLLSGLDDESRIKGCEIDELASTLLLAAVDENHYVLIHIGDGVIGYLDAGRLKVASTPDNGEFSNVTTFVTSKDALRSMRMFKGELKEKDSFVLMSDGTEQSLYHKSSHSLTEAVVKLMHLTCLIRPEQMKKQLEEAFSSVITKNTQDDCSIAIIARLSPKLSSIEALPFEKRRELYGISAEGRNTRKRVKRFDVILSLAQQPCSLSQIARDIHLKPKYTKKQVDRLIKLGILARNNHLYHKPK